MKNFSKTLLILFAATILMISFASCQRKNTNEVISDQSFNSANSDVTDYSEQTVENIKYEIDSAYNFSIGRAWIKYGSTLALIDTTGNQLFQTTNSDCSVREMSKEISCVIINEIPTVKYLIINKKDGKVLNTYTSDDFDSLLETDGGYAVFSKTKTTIDNSSIRFCVVDSTGAMINESAPFPKKDDGSYLCFDKYIGNGIFSIYYKDNQYYSNKKY